MLTKFHLGFFLITLTLLASCTLPVKDNNLQEIFNNYSSRLKANNTYTDQELENLFQYFSPRYQTEILNGRPVSTKVIKHLITKYFSTPLELITTLSHYETHTKASSCLLINVITKKNERVSLYVTYVNQKNWLIDNVNLGYLGEKEEYLETPICDVDTLMKKRMETWSE